MNNGSLSTDLELTRGVRQGHPQFPYLFKIAAEIPAAAVQNSSEIKGFKLGSEEFEIVQYADDLTAFLSDIKSV